MYPWTLLDQPPAPTWPGYNDLLYKAMHTVPPFVDPANLYPCREAVERRGEDWATAVLAYPFDVCGYRRLTSVQDRLLQLADEAGIDPPLPEWIVAGRTTDQRRRELLAEGRRLRAEHDAAAWQQAIADTDVTFEVHENPHANVRGGERQHLRHAVPTVAVYSGTRKIRTHPTGRALCETETRSRPLHLDDTPCTSPVTCKSCLSWASKVRPSRET